MPTQPYIKADGTPVKGVTTLIGGNLGWNKGQLIGWAFKQGKLYPEAKSVYDTTNDACSIGTIAHAMAEADIKGKAFVRIPEWTDELIEKAKEAYQGYLQWKSMTKLELVASEISLVSEAYSFGGTIDAVARLGDGFALIDFKTSNGLYADHLIQVRAYAQLLQECKPEWPLTNGLHILRFAKDTGDFHHHGYANLDECWEVFLCLLKMESLKRRIDKRAA